MCLPGVTAGGSSAFMPVCGVGGWGDFLWKALTESDPGWGSGV